jgi:hypothetical protein
MQYMLLIHADEAGFAALPKDQVERALGAYTAYTEALKKAGVLVDSHRLQPTAAATTVRVADGKTQVLDGPNAEAKEQLGGYYLIEAPDRRSDFSGGALSRCFARYDGDSANLGDLFSISAG